MKADAVFSGGGIKGLAFAGALTAAAKAGYTEWCSLAGTSAGAISAMAMAVGYTADGLNAQLEKVDTAKIADYGGPLKLGVIENVALRRGLTHGKFLHEWIEQLLVDAPHPAKKFGDLEPGKLQVVGTDLSHGRMVVFPQGVSQYLDDDGKPLVPDEFPIADAVRISAGFPYFFPPLKLRDKDTKKDGTLVDGGVTSSFPIFLFDSEQPTRPTWGFQLFGGSDADHPTYKSIGGVEWPVQMLEGIIDTAINALDTFANIGFNKRTIMIPTGAVPTLEFNLSAEQKKFLYDSGYDAAKKFFDANPDGRNSFGLVPKQAPA